MKNQSILPAQPAAADAASPRPAPVSPASASGRTSLAGVSFLQQEPGLARELRLTAREMSGWAAGGSGVPD